MYRTSLVWIMSNIRGRVQADVSRDVPRDASACSKLKNRWLFSRAGSSSRNWSIWTRCGKRWKMRKVVPASSTRATRSLTETTVSSRRLFTAKRNSSIRGKISISPGETFPAFENSSRDGVIDEVNGYQSDSSGKRNWRFLRFRPTSFNERIYALLIPTEDDPLATRIDFRFLPRKRGWKKITFFSIEWFIVRLA